LADPIEIEPLPSDLVPEVIAHRVAVFKMSEDAYVPVEEKGFEHIFSIVRGNLRSALSHSEQFAVWMYQEDDEPSTSDAKFELLRKWLAERADIYELDTQGMTDRSWEVFEALVNRGGYCSPSDYEDFGFNNATAMQRHLRRLQQANLVDSTVDETDRRRKAVSLTDQGWFINYKRGGYPLSP
jgi:hypothetical protein